MKNKYKGYSYLSVIISLVIIMTLSLSFVSTVVLTNNSNDLANKNIISLQVADSFLELSEAELRNYMTSDTMEESLISYIHQAIQTKVDVFNAKNKSVDISLYFHCNAICNDLTNNEHRLIDKVYSPNEIEVSAVVKYKSYNVNNETTDHTVELSRLVVLE